MTAYTIKLKKKKKQLGQFRCNYGNGIIDQYIINVDKNVQ